jgi:hypothetical protein
MQAFSSSFHRRRDILNQGITSLMTRPFPSGNQIDNYLYDRDAGTSGCLLLDTVMQGRGRESRCKLLEMPAEILAIIVDLLADDKLALASLALAGRDSHYLARSRQFAEIQFDYSNRAQQLLLHLENEALPKMDVTTSALPIGICVRKVKFSSPPEHVRAYHKELYDSTLGDRASSCSWEQQNKLQQEAEAHYIALRKSLTVAITRAMPNLEVLTWEDKFPIEGEFFEEISRCSAKHIKLKRVKVDKPGLMKPSLTPVSWPLRSLDLDVELAHDWHTDQLESEVIRERESTEKLDNPMSLFFDTLFQRCAATLESLTWRSMGPWPERRISLGRKPPSFPLLRSLRLGYISLCPRAFSSLLSSPLRHLQLPMDILSESLAECLATCEPLRHLESLQISPLPSQSRACEHVATFIGRHKHVHKLYVHESASTDLDSLIIPVIEEGGFHNLRCLSLAWGDRTTDVSETALMILGAIVSLERLSLRAGYNFGDGNKWLVDHDKLRQHLKTLGRLKVLALVGDTYPIPSDRHANVEEYYSLRHVGNSERVDARARTDLNADQPDFDDTEKIWESAHQNRMLKEAEAYSAVFPALQWILCGQWPMKFRRDVESDVSPKRAIPLTPHRDENECWTFLGRSFGIR